MKKYLHQFKKGFTVLEAIIAIAVVGVAIGGATTAIRTGISSATLAKEQVKAFYFAQEAIEVIRNKRDANQLDVLLNGTGTNWLAGIAANSSDPCWPGNTCYVDAYGPGTPPVYLYRCSGGFNSCPLLKQNGSTGSAAYIYGYTSGWTDTKYRREVQTEIINKAGSPNELVVTVRVSWTHGSSSREFKTKTILTKWAS